MLSLEWILTSAGLNEGNDDNMSGSSYLQHELDGTKSSRGPSAEVI